MVDIVILTTNTIIYDPRVKRIVKSLKKRSYSILALGWNRQGVSREQIDSYVVGLQLFNLRAPEGKLTIIARFPLFWIWVFIKLLLHRPQVVHACDLDSVIPCYFYKVIFRKRLVFDVHDRYAMAFISPKSKALYSVVNVLEELFAKRADVLTTVGEKLLMTFRKKPRWCEIIMNCAEDHADEGAELREDSNDFLRIVYTGAIIRKRGLEKVIDAIRDLKNVELITAGPVIDKQLLDQILKLPFVKYMGLLLPEEALTLEARSDVMIALYDLKTAQNVFALPLKVWEAMMCGIPIITNVAHELIDEVKCGIMVEYNNLEQIKDAVVSLRENKGLRRTLGNNGRKAFLQKYNWSIMEQRLYKIYDCLLLK